MLLLKGISEVGRRKLKTGSSSLSVGDFPAAPARIASTSVAVGWSDDIATLIESV